MRPTFHEESQRDLSGYGNHDKAMVSGWDARGEDLLFAVYALRMTDHEKKKPSVSSVRGKQVVRSGRQIPDSVIDFSDIPELSDEQLKRMRRIGRPATRKKSRQSWSNSILLLISSGLNCPTKQNNSSPLLDNHRV